MGRYREMNRKQIHIGSTALVRLYDGREVEAHVDACPGALSQHPPGYCS